MLEQNLKSKQISPQPLPHFCGVILAAGAGTRLGLANALGGKAMAKVKEKPLLGYGLEKLARAGLQQVAVVVNPENAKVIQGYGGDGRNWGLQLTYIIQAKPLGIAQALGLCRDFAKGRKTLLLLADNLFEAEIQQAVMAFALAGKGCKIFLTKVENPQEYGVALVESGVVKELVEKPSKPLSPWAVIGLYLYDEQVFKLIEGLKPSARGELEITDVNLTYLQADALAYEYLQGNWLDIGTKERLLEAERLF